MSVAAVSDPRIEKILRDQTIRVFNTLNGNGYARCDYRMDSTGAIYMLEINPNCGIFYSPSEPGSADFSLMNDPINHPKFLKLIVRSALKRQAESRARRIREKVKEKEMVYA
jgi:D-alanine-D-alanine ligase